MACSIWQNDEHCLPCKICMTLPSLGLPSPFLPPSLSPLLYPSSLVLQILRGGRVRQERKESKHNVASLSWLSLRIMHGQLLHVPGPPCKRPQERLHLSTGCPRRGRGRNLSTGSHSPMVKSLLHSVNSSSLPSCFYRGIEHVSVINKKSPRWKVTPTKGQWEQHRASHRGRTNLQGP